VLKEEGSWADGSRWVMVRGEKEEKVLTVTNNEK
jgi:hypothetical protein